MFDSKSISRREFLKTTALITASTLSSGAISVVQTVPSDGSTRGGHRLIEGWEYHQGSLGGAWDVWPQDRNNDVSWQAVQVPHCFNARDAVDPDMPYYQGHGWYRIKLRPRNPFPDGRVLLHLEGAGQKSEIFVGLDRVGRHAGGYDEFIVDITESVAKTLKNPGVKGEAPVAILCDNSRDADLVPSALNDFTRYGGLYRHVNLLYMPVLYLERLHVDVAVRPGQPAQVVVKGRLSNPASLHEDVQIQVRVFDPGGSILHTFSAQVPVWTGDQEISTFEVKIPQLWSPNRPSLYRCEVKLTSRHGEMSITERFGFRYFEFVAHGPFKLNGERLLLRGTSRHEDHAQFGAAMPDDLIRKEMQLIKDLGANFIRLGHHQQSRAVLDLCDALGILVWEEIPWSRGGSGGERYQEHVRDMLRSMIDQHYNHPSIIVWGLGNENDFPGDFPDLSRDRIRSFTKVLNDQAHALDSSRKTGIRRCDFCKDIVDVYSPSLWPGRNHSRYTEYKELCRKEMEDVDHFLHLEWGGESHARRHSEDIDRLLAKAVTRQGSAPELDDLLNGGHIWDTTDESSETYMCNVFDWHLKEQETMPWLTGSTQWIFKDFASPLRPSTPVPYVNQMGLVERDLALKESYYVFQSYWSEMPMVHIYGHTWPIRWGSQDEQKLIKVYSNCERAELFFNGVSQGVKRRNSQDFPAAGLRWLVKMRAGENHLRVVALKNGRIISDEVRFLYQTEKWEQPVRLDLRETERMNQIVTLEARVFDKNNVLCLDARNSIRFGVAGDGVLLDNLGTSTSSRSVQLYNGRAMIKLSTNRGKSVASVTSIGLQTAFVTVE
jgi:beta-galactosidase